MLTYIIQVILFQVLFLAVYDFFLSKETFFTKNRFYLLATAVLSFVLPLLKIPTLQKTIPEEYTILLPEIILSPQAIIEKTSWYQSINYMDVLFGIGSLLFLTVFIIKLGKIISLILNYEKIPKEGYKLILLPKNSKAFSFFNYIFIGKEIPEEKKSKIIEHELVHSKQKHTIDLLIFEVLKIVMWFNPMLYVYQKRIALVHEFISDETVSKSTEKTSYINNLLSEIFQVEHISFINQFYKHSLIKKRIIMMTKKQSKKIKQLKYLLLVPVLASMLFYTACSNNEITEEAVEKTKTIVEKKEKEIQPPIPKELIKKIKEQTGKENISEKEMEEFLQEVLRKKYKASLEKGNMPFSAVDKVPAFINKGEGKEAFNRNMREFVKENFNTDLVNSLGLEPGKKRIYVQFKIDKEGNAIDTKVRAPHPKLKEEALRMIKKMPKLQPGEDNGKVVKVGYTLPISFEVK